MMVWVLSYYILDFYSWLLSPRSLFFLNERQEESRCGGKRKGEELGRLEGEVQEEELIALPFLNPSDLKSLDIMYRQRIYFQ